MSTESVNKNLITELFFAIGEEGLYYIQSKGSLFIFKREGLLNNYKFLSIFMYSHVCNGLEWKFGRLDETSILYQEHYEAFNKDAILYKYIHHLGLIARTVISKDDKNNKLFMESDFLGLENYKESKNSLLLYQNQKKREIYEGVSLGEYLQDKSYIEEITTYRYVLDYLFSHYSSGSNKVSGKLLDCHRGNIIINSSGIFPIDQEIIYKVPIDKNMLIYRLCSHLYDHFVKYYKLPSIPASQYKNYPTDQQKTENMVLAHQKNHHLFTKYFGEIGLKSRKSIKLPVTPIKEDCPENIVSMIDASYYIKEYPSYIMDKLPPEIHYMQIGWKRGYNPSDKFDTNQYLEDNPDVARSGINPLEHYVLYGKKEGRKITSPKMRKARI